MFGTRDLVWPRDLSAGELFRVTSAHTSIITKTVVYKNNNNHSYLNLRKKCHSLFVCPANSWKASRGGVSQVHEHVLQNKLSYKVKQTF